MKWIEIDQDYLRRGTAISSRASHEHYLRFLVLYLFVSELEARM